VSQEKVCGLKNMKNFDFKQCSEYAKYATSSNPQVKTISQTHNSPMCLSPHSAFYQLNFNQGNLNLTYEFD
jgi:hypothetical protein